MKWPNTVTAIRHGESDYNVLKAAKNADPKYRDFKRAFNRRKKDPETAKALAEELMRLGSFVLGVGDHGTALTDKGVKQAQETGKNLSKIIELPDVVFVSPYDRTHQTLDNITHGWPELKEVKTIEDERLREQEHGKALLYNDWRIFHVLNPDEEALYDLEGSYYYRYPNGESVPDVRERTRSLFTSIARDYSEKNVLLVTHHLSILALRANLERLDAGQFHDLDENHKPINCGVTVYKGYPDLGQNGKLLLDMYNQRLYPEDL